MSPIMAKVASEADFIQCDITLMMTVEIIHTSSMQ